MKLLQQLMSLMFEEVPEVERVKLTQFAWNPVKDGLPKKSGDYLVTMKCKFREVEDYIVVVTYYSTRTKRFMINNNTITAWMEIPKPYIK